MVDKIIKALPEKTFTEKMDESELLELKDSIETVDKIKRKLNSTYIYPANSLFSHHNIFIR